MEYAGSSEAIRTSAESYSTESKQRYMERNPAIGKEHLCGMDGMIIVAVMGHLQLLGEVAAQLSELNQKLDKLGMSSVSSNKASNPSQYQTPVA